MKTVLLTGFIFGLFLPTHGQEMIPSREVQVKSAVLAAPEALRDETTVYGYDQEGEFVLLRKGSNVMICLADDPTSKGFSVACYPEDLEPFMARGRELKKEGKSFKEIFEQREKEVQNNQLKMPKDGTTLFVYFTNEESAFNPNTGEVREGNFRYVVYIPYATAETTGLPLSPEAPGMPWIMDPGTHRAHIMINPPTN